MAAFVHLDAKSDAQQFTKVDHAVFCDRRPVYWGEFSQVDATLTLMRTAMADPRGFAYLVFLSGADYPLCPPEQIRTFFEDRPGQEFLNIVAMPSEAASKPLSRLTRYKVQSGRPLTMVEKAVRKVLAAALPTLSVRNAERGLEGLQPFAGSSWWALSRDACAHILAVVAARPKLVRFLRHSWYPDETIFQTILGNSPFRTQIRRNVTFTDWGGGGAHPAGIGPQHLDRFLQSPVRMDDAVYGAGEALFARKFSDADAQLIDRLDEIIAHKRQVAQASERTI